MTRHRTLVAIAELELEHASKTSLLVDKIRLGEDYSHSLNELRTIREDLLIYKHKIREFDYQIL